MAKPVGSTPLMIAIAERVGTAVGLIVARTSDAVEGATKSLKPAARTAQPKKTARVRRVRVAKRKTGTIEKKVVRTARSRARTRKRPAKK